MKRITAFFIVCLLLFSLTACNGKKKENYPKGYPSFDLTEPSDSGNGSLSFPATESDATLPDFSAPLPSFTLPDGKNDEGKTLPFSPSSPDDSGNIGSDFQYNLDPEDLERFKNMDSYKIRAITVKRSQLIADLFLAFSKAELDICIDEVNGIVTLDEAILFSGDSAVLSESGKEFLNKFIKTYTSVLLKSNYDDFISKVLVEGHTARLENSTYESGLPLSAERANNVKNYCLSSSSGLSDDAVAWLTPLLIAEGCSNTRPVFNSDGSIDLDSSRRVTFRFLINID